MQPPDELMMGVLLPSMRQLVSRVLRAQGFSQNRISSMLGMTQAAVSLYLSSPAEKAYRSLASLSLSRESADTYASLLAEDLKRSPVYAVGTLNSLWTGLLGAGLVCGAHRDLYPSLAQCDVCVREYGSRRRDRTGAVAEVADAVKLIESSRKFVSVMPEVSVNIACVAGDSVMPQDVVAVPGRVVKVRDRAKAILPPEFGASGHMARMLVLVRRMRSEVRAVINLRYNARMARVLKKLGLRLLEIGDYAPSGREDPTVEALESRIRGGTRPFDAVVDLGGKGIEPDVYLFGRGAVEVSRLAVKVADLYAGD